jgi:phosphate uptake regulator
MEQRKLIKLGNSSFAIALPKNWVDKSGLKKGDHIFLEENGNGEIIIQPSPIKNPAEKISEVEIGEKDLKNIRRDIISHYINGCTTFHIKGKRNKEINTGLREVFKELIGVEIISNEQEMLIAKDMFNMEEINVNNFIRRIDNNISEMFEALIDGIKNKSISQQQLNDLNSADEDINKFEFLISRILSIGVGNPSVLTKIKLRGLDLIGMWWFAFNLEHIGDEIKAVAKIIKTDSINQKEVDILGKIVSDLQKIYRSSLEFFYSASPEKEKALSNVEEGRKIWEELNELALNKDTKIARIAMKLRDLETYSYQNTKMMLNLKTENGIPR